MENLAIPDTELYEDVPNGIHHKYFSGRDVVTFAELEARIEHGQWPEQFDAMKLWLLYMLNCVLIGAKKRASIPIWQLHLVDNLEAFNAFLWDLHVYKYFIFRFKKAILKRPSRYKIFGLAYALLMFAEADLTATEAERGLWYYQGIDEVVPYHWERRFAKVISALNALREEVRKSDKDKLEQHQELVDMICKLQGTSTEVHTDEPMDVDADMTDVGAQSQQDTVTLNSVMHDHVAVPAATSSGTAQQQYPVPMVSTTPIVSTIGSMRGLGSRIVVGPDAPQILIPAIVISKTTYVTVDFRQFLDFGLLGRVCLFVVLDLVETRYICDDIDLDRLATVVWRRQRALPKYYDVLLA
ncbi:hypothetical protein Dsin_027163 [Dipteronia sinensis]|uniref:Uncharacterized protein n=1 Tax=Dipteronia sinensis TaxID=43782 RepID=A0AAE0A0K6_9ROSI|nr:hypothetical protein Dsin_027163 [Dipteronia sinensis]